MHYHQAGPQTLDSLRTGIAYLAPEPPPRLYASMHFALAYDAASGQLALSRFDDTTLRTTWLQCAAENEHDG